MFYFPKTDFDYRYNAVIDITRDSLRVASEALEEAKPCDYSYHQNGESSAAYCGKKTSGEYNLSVIPQFSVSGIQFQLTGFLSQGGDPTQTGILSKLVSDALISASPYDTNFSTPKPATSLLAKTFSDLDFKQDPPAFALVEMGFDEKWQYQATITSVGKMCVWIGNTHLQTKHIIVGSKVLFSDFATDPDKCQMRIAGPTLQPGDYCVIVPEEALTSRLHEVNLALDDEANSVDVVNRFKSLFKPNTSTAILVLQMPNPQKELIRALICQPENAPRILRDMATRKHMFSEIAVLGIIQTLKTEERLKSKNGLFADDCAALDSLLEDDATFTNCLSEHQLRFADKYLPDLIQKYFELDGLIQSHSKLTLYSNLFHAFWRIVSRYPLDIASLLFSAITCIPEVTGYSYGYFYNSCASDWPSCCEKIQSLALAKFAGIYQRLAPEQQTSLWNHCLTLPIFAFNHSIHYFARLANSTALNRLNNLDLPPPLDQIQEGAETVSLADLVEDLRIGNKRELSVRLASLNTLIHYKHRIPEMLPILAEYCEIDRIIRHGRGRYSGLESAFMKALQLFSLEDVNLLFCAVKSRPSVTGFTTGMMWQGNSHEWIACCENIQAAAKKRFRSIYAEMGSSAEKNTYLSKQHELEIFTYNPQTNGFNPASEIREQLAPSLRYVRLI